MFVLPAANALEASYFTVQKMAQERPACSARPCCRSANALLHWHSLAHGPTNVQTRRTLWLQIFNSQFVLVFLIFQTQAAGNATVFATSACSMACPKTKLT